MCVVGAGVHQAATNKLPVSTPATAGIEFLAGGRDPIQNFKETTGAGKTFFPQTPKVNTPSARSGASKKAKRNSTPSQRTGGGLRANNPALSGSGLQIT